MRLIHRRLILTYLIPCHLLTTHTLPSAHLLSSYPRLELLFRPLAVSIKKGDLSGFDAALARGENEFVKRRIYLTLERGRDIALRNLFRKVFIAGGYEEAKEGAPAVRRTRVPVAEFAAAMRLGNQAEANARTDMDEVECLLANMIYKVRTFLTLTVLPGRSGSIRPFYLAVSWMDILSLLRPLTENSDGRAT
jgi:COP9 signalosome complex subunit 12